MFVDKSRTYIGIVEDNQDPKKLGRCRVRVIDIFDDIPADDIPWASPWKDLNGNGFNVPEKGKVLTVIFDSGNIYKPEYLYAEHYNINLEKKLQTLSGTNYTSMKSLIFDHKTQIYVNDDEGLKLDHKFNMINITKEGIDLNLKDNFAKLKIGTSTANQQAILGNHFLDWFDEFVSNLLGERSGPYLGNLGAPVVCNPEFIECLQKYRALKDPKFLSHHVDIVDNEYVNKLDRVNDSQVGDKYKSTNSPGGGGNTSPSGYSSPPEPVDYTPKDGCSTNTPDGQLSTSPSSQDNGQTGDVPGDPVPTSNPDVNKLIEAMQKLRAKCGGQGYEILSKPYEMNIVAVRYQYEGANYTNKHSDDLYLFYKDDKDLWQLHKYKISTMPGVYKAIIAEKKNKNGKIERYLKPSSKGVNVKVTDIMKGRGGIGILKEGFYKNIYKIGDYKGNPGMITTGKQKSYRDESDGMKIVYKKDKSGNTYVREDKAQMYMHKGYPGGTTVDNWSEGCQVFKDSASMNQFFEKCQIHSKKYGNLFNYTLMLGTDLDGITGDNIATGGPSNQGGGGGGAPAANVQKPTPNPEEQKSLDEYKQIVRLIQNIYRLGDNTYTPNNEPLFQDTKGTFNDDAQMAVDRLYELLELKSSNQSWAGKLSLNKLIPAHKTSFLQELEQLKKYTLDKTNTYNFKVPKITNGLTEQPIPISTDF